MRYPACTPRLHFAKIDARGVAVLKILAPLKGPIFRMQMLLLRARVWRGF